ncbi:MAG: GNAT family N-acetyltransferase [Alphaproteobacteria bacterium]|nr:GNAT family N-acetyltransferase [Alphaproteobacteria bacterium]
MPDGAPSLTIETVDSLRGVATAEWDACAGADNPFVSYAFLDAIERSGSGTAETGWGPRHLLARDSGGTLLGAVPMYLKGHSYGEYVFDHSWAEAYRRAGGRYYPKLQACVPFTPVPGPRLLARPGPFADSVRAALADTLASLPKRLGVSSLHVTFCQADEAEMLEDSGMVLRQGFQFHWTNPGYPDFEAFLGTLSHSRRKSIRKERREVADQGIEHVRLTGQDITAEHWDAFFGFYISTSDRKWGSPYLTREFFDMIGAVMAEKILLVMARREGNWIAGALNLIGADTLYGRNWGCSEDHRFLHFETCYYQALEFAIERGLARVEAGAQGEHKLQRGYMPVPVWSAHSMREEGFRTAVAEFCKREAEAVAGHIAELAAEGPFKSKPL